MLRQQRSSSSSAPGPGSLTLGAETRCRRRRFTRDDPRDQLRQQSVRRTALSPCGWMVRITDGLENDLSLSANERSTIGAPDIHQVRTGIVDSLCEQLLREVQAPDTIPSLRLDNIRHFNYERGTWATCVREISSRDNPLLPDLPNRRQDADGR